MAKLQVVEHFVSINGEGRKAGQLAHFVRFAGCNLSCSYCDTRWANEADVPYERMRAGQIYQLLKDAGICNVTLTGGEPLLQEGIGELLGLLRGDSFFEVEIETNGAVDISPFLPDTEQFSSIFKSGNRRNAGTGQQRDWNAGTEQPQDRSAGVGQPLEQQDNVSFTMDYKLAGSGMEQKMLLSNYVYLRSCDTVKFVVSSREELLKCREIIERFNLAERGCGIYLSPCFGRIAPSELVDFMKEQTMNHVNMQLQLHKLIWDPDQRGV